MPPSSSRYPGTPSVGRLMTAPQAQCRRGSMAFCRGWSRMAPALTRQRQTPGAAAPSPAAAAAPRSTTSARTNPHSRAKTHRAFVQSGFNEVLASAHVATLAPPPRTSQKPPDSTAGLSGFQSCAQRQPARVFQHYPPIAAIHTARCGFRKRTFVQVVAQPALLTLSGPSMARFSHTLCAAAHEVTNSSSPSESA